MNEQNNDATQQAHVFDKTGALGLSFEHFGEDHIPKRVEAWAPTSTLLATSAAQDTVYVFHQVNNTNH